MVLRKKRKQIVLYLSNQQRHLKIFYFLVYGHSIQKAKRV